MAIKTRNGWKVTKPKKTRTRKTNEGARGKSLPPQKKGSRSK